MDIFNYYGLIAIILILIPNIVWALSKKGDFKEFYHNKAVELLEQIGRFGCFGMMIINIPYTYFGFFFNLGKLIYPIFSGIMVCVYIIGWIAKGKKDGVGYALLLSIVPSVLFLVDGILILSIPLIVFALIFAPCHIIISYKNAKYSCLQECEKTNKQLGESPND